MSNQSADRRLSNVRFGNALLDREIDYRNERKRDQENTARAVVVAAGALMAVLLTLSGDRGVLSADASWWTRGFLIATLAVSVAAATCAVYVQFPRKYQRLGSEAFEHFNQSDFLDSEEHQVLGQTLAARIGIAKTMDDRHEEKARLLKWSFRLFGLALVGLLGQGISLAIDPPQEASSAPRPILIKKEIDHAGQPPTRPRAAPPARGRRGNRLQPPAHRSRDGSRTGNSRG